MVGLIAPGELSYNGYTFEGASHITAEQAPEYDSSGRSVKYVVHTITVEAVIAIPNEDEGTSACPADPTDDAMEDIRYRLSQPRKTLKFINKGYGADLVINNGEGDVDFGPKPRIITWKPIGSRRACEVVWSVQVCKLACDSEGKADGKEIIEYSFGIQYSINNFGDTTRTINGVLEIALNANPDGTIDSTVDDYFSQVLVTPIAGFHRDITRNIESNKKRMTFTITDRQIPSPRPYPSGMVEVSGTHEVNWARGAEQKRQKNTINMTLSPEASLSGAEAWATFVSITKQRMTQVISNGGKNWPFITSLRVSENLWGRPQSFSVKYWVLGCLKDIVGASGLWTPLAGESWGQWRSSITGTAYQNYGSGGFKTSPQWDVVLDMCEEPSIPTVNPNGTTLVGTGGGGTLSNSTPPKEASWLAYEAHIVPGRTRPTSRAAILQERDYEKGNSESESKFDYGEQGGKDDIIQEGGRSRYTYEMRFHAVRAGHDIPRPRVLTVNGKEAVESWSSWSLDVVGDYLGVPVKKMTGKVLYVLKNAISGLSAEDKMDCVPGTPTGDAGGGGDDAGGGQEANENAGGEDGGGGGGGDDPPAADVELPADFPTTAPSVDAFINDHLGGSSNSFPSTAPSVDAFINQHLGGIPDPGNAAAGSTFVADPTNPEGNIWQLNLNTPEPSTDIGYGGGLDEAHNNATDIFNNL